MPFLTDLDENSRVKGSRDPLGLIPLWSHFGRKVVGNLTTASNSVRGFTTLLIGLYCAEEIRERGTSDESELATFLKFEQLAAYCRYELSGDQDFRGLRRVRALLNESRRVTISARQQEQILSNQKQYGLWGMFTTPAQLSKLLEPSGRRLTPDARSFVEQQYISKLPSRRGRPAGELLELLEKSSASVELKGKHGALCKAIADLHSRTLHAREKAFYGEALAFGDEPLTHGRQRRLAAAIAPLALAEFGFEEFRAAKKRLRSDEEMTAVLHEIETVELFIIPVASAFGFVLKQQNQTLEHVAATLKKMWGNALAHIDPVAVGAIRDQIRTALGDEQLTNNWVAFSELLRNGDYLQFVEQLLVHNARIMQLRNSGSPWVRIEDGRLRVLTIDEANDLLPRDQLENYWRSTYFINSLAGIVRDVGLAA